jgi:hypothetical protein
VVGNGVDTAGVVVEVAEQGEHHPGDTGLTAAPPAVVDAAVAL